MIMQAKPQLPVASVIKHEDKSEKLKGFIQSWLVQVTSESESEPASGAAVSEHRRVTLVARSPNSPVACAVADLSAAIATAGYAVNVVFSTLDAEAPAADWRVIGESPSCLGELRVARNPRLADAHEQLVLSDNVCWIGDSMRRDPSKRDAFEVYATGYAATVQLAATSFSRLWAVCAPVKLTTTRPRARTTTTAVATDPKTAATAIAAAMAGDAPHVVVSTLH
jgi:hypothetical protein